MENKRKKYLLLSIVIFIALLIAGTVFFGRLFMRFGNDAAAIKSYIDSFGGASRLVFIAIQVLQVVFAVIPGELTEIAAGYIFGAWEGLVLCEIGIAIATVLIFRIMKTIGQKALDIFIDPAKHKKFTYLLHEERLVFILFLLFFIPVIPKDILIYVSALTYLRTYHFLLLSMIARIPSILSSTFAGEALGSSNYTLTIIIYAVTGIISAIGLLIYKRHLKKRNISTDG